MAAGAAQYARWIVGTQSWDVWYRELRPGEHAWQLSPLVWSHLALGLIAAALPHALTEARAARTRRARGAAWLGASFLAGAALARGSLSGFALVALVAVSWIVLSGGARFRRVLCLAVVCAAVVAGAFVARARLAPHLRGSIAGARHTVQQRDYAWRTAAAMVARRPAIGHGTGQFASAYGGHRSSQPTERHQAVARPVSPRSDLLHAAAELGIPATLALAWLCLCALVARRSGADSTDVTPWRVALVAVLGCSLLSGHAYCPLNLAVLMVTVGVLRSRGPDPTRRRSGLRAVLVACLVGLPFALSPVVEARYGAERPTLADHHSPEWLLSQARRVVASDAETAGDLLAQALCAFPARRAAVSASPVATAGELRGLAYRHAESSELLADVRESEGDRQAAAAFRALALQIRVAP